MCSLELDLIVAKLGGLQPAYGPPHFEMGWRWDDPRRFSNYTWIFLQAAGGSDPRSGKWCIASGRKDGFHLIGDGSFAAVLDALDGPLGNTIRGYRK